MRRRKTKAKTQQTKFIDDSDGIGLKQKWAKSLFRGNSLLLSFVFHYLSGSVRKHAEQNKSVLPLSHLSHSDKFYKISSLVQPELGKM